jgi:YVTN family beta-propeller protein
MRRRSIVPGCVVALFVGLPALLSCVGLRAERGASSPPELKPLLRRPVALVLADKGRWLFAANQRSGTISVLDTDGGQVVAELPVGRRLADLVVTPDERHLLAVDDEANELVVLSRQGSTLTVANRLPVSVSPVSVVVVPDGKRCFVASLWSRRLTVVKLSPTPREAGTIDLPFAPGRQVLLRERSKLAVADAFGGQLAVVDVGRGEVESVRTLPATNTRGLAVSPDGERLLLSHQVLNRYAQSSFNDIHWGNLITNTVRSIAVTSLLKPDADLLSGSRLSQLGDVGSGGGDPAGMSLTHDGTLVVALAGVQEIAIGREKDASLHRVTVGARPTAVVLTPDERHALVANTLDDSISVVDLRTRKVQKTIPLGPQPALSASDRGEVLFYNAHLTHDGWFSCHSCHTDGHTNGQLADTRTDSSFGTPKRILSLRGVRETGPWAWIGSMPDLESQVRQSIQSTMHGPKPTEEQVRDLTAFLQTLPPPPVVGPVDDALAQRGKAVFEKHSCNTCHAPPTYTSGKTYDVGLADEVGERLFNPPSLRGVRHGGPYFHDNRAATLEEVFTRHRHQLKGELSGEDLTALVGFLRSL